MCCFFFFQAEDGIRDLVRSRGLGDVYKRQVVEAVDAKIPLAVVITEGVAVKDTAEFFEYAQKLSLIHI